MTLPTTTTLNDCEPDDSDMFGPPRSSPPPSHQRGSLDGTNGGYHSHRSRVPMISPKLRQREERKRILQLCAHKLERIKDSETNLRRSVCINNTYCRLTDELRREKQSRYLANLPKSESKPETARDNIFNPYNSCSLDNSNHQSATQQQQQHNINKSCSSSETTTVSSSSSANAIPYHHLHHHNHNVNADDADDDDDDEIDVDDVINNSYNSNANHNNSHHNHHYNNNNALCDIENQPALGHEGQLGHVVHHNSHHNHHNNNKLHATESFTNCVAAGSVVSHALNDNSNASNITSSPPSISSSTLLLQTPSSPAPQPQSQQRKRQLSSSSSFDTDLERLDRELNAINAPMPLIDPEITQGAEQLEKAISSRKRLRSEDESDRLVREALSQFYIPPQRFISAIEDCPLDVVGVGNVSLNMGNISPKRQKLSTPDLELDFDVNQNSKDFEVIMDALRLGTPSPTSSMSSDSCGQAAMMSEAASVFHNLVVTSLET